MSRSMLDSTGITKLKADGTELLQEDGDSCCCGGKDCSDGCAGCCFDYVFTVTSESGFCDDTVHVYRGTAPDAVPTDHPACGWDNIGGNGLIACSGSTTADGWQYTIGGCSDLTDLSQEFVPSSGPCPPEITYTVPAVSTGEIITVTLTCNDMP